MSEIKPTIPDLHVDPKSVRVSIGGVTLPTRFDTITYPEPPLPPAPVLFVRVQRSEAYENWIQSLLSTEKEI